MATNKIVYGGRTLMDLTGDNVQPENVEEGVTFHDASGEQRSGTLPRTVSADNVFFSDGENFQQKYDEGELNGPAGTDGQQGPPGEAGYTPVRGTDYWTAEDQNAIVSQAVTQIQPDISGIKDDLSAEQTAREQADTSLQQEISGKLPKSPADLEPWTADEQEAAREQMNAQGYYKHIATITIDEDGVYNVGIDRDENGMVFSVSDVYIYGYVRETGIKSVLAVAINTITTSVNGSNNIIRLPTSYIANGAQFELNIKKSKYWRAYAVSSTGVSDPNISSATGYTSVAHRGASNVRNNEWETLTALAFATNNSAFGIGTTFDIWGR